MASKRWADVHLRISEEEKKRIERYQAWLAKEGAPGVNITMSDAMRSLFLRGLIHFEAQTATSQKGRVS